MRRYTIAFAVALVAGCAGNGSTSVTPSSTPPSDSGGGGGAGNGGGSPGGGSPGGGSSADGGMPGGGGLDGGMPGGGVDGGGSDGGSSGACTDTQPVAIASAERGANALAVDDTDVYFVAEQMPTMENDWHLFRAPATGGAAVEIGSTGNWTYERMTVNATAVFTLSRDGVLLRWPKSGGAPSTLFDGRTDAATGCLADAHHGTITRYSLDGTRADVLADRAGIIGGMVVRGSYVYYTFENDSTVYRVCK